MRRLARWTLNALTAVSLLMCVATAAIWIRSEYRWDQLQYRWCGPKGTPWTEHSLGWNRGSFRYWGDFDWPVQSMGTLGWEASSRAVESRNATVARWRARGFYFLGFAFKGGRITGTAAKSFGLLIPHWFVMLLTALVPARWCVGWRREKGNPPTSACVSCSYDLTGNVSGVCPECGNKVAAPPVPESTPAR